MIHYQAIDDLEEEIKGHELTIILAYDEQDKSEAREAIERAREELTKLQQEQEEYRDGYDAGREFHMGGGVMRDEWLGRFGAFRQGFDAAGADS